MTFSQIKGIFTFLLLAICCQMYRGLKIIDTPRDVWTILQNSVELECIVDSTWQWCYWENLKESQKYPITMNDTSNEDNGNLLLSTSSESCKITIHLDGSEERAQKYIGDWKCHLAKTDTDEVSSSYKDEQIITLHLAVPAGIHFSIEYNNERKDVYKVIQGEEILPFDSGEVIEKTRILSTNESVCEIKDTDFQNGIFLLPLVMGNEVILNCDIDSSIAKPEPNLSLWLSSPIEDQLISKVSSSFTYVPKMEDDRKRFECFSIQKNEFLSFEAIKSYSFPIYVMSIPSILEYPTNTQKLLKENDLDLIPISLQFYSQPPPQKNSIFWTFNDVIIKPNQTIEVENDLILRTSDVIPLKKKDSPSVFQIDLFISKGLFSSHSNISIIASIGNRLGKVNWSYDYNEDFFSSRYVVSWLSMSHFTTYLIIILLVLNLFLIGIWCTCCCCCGSICRCCLCPFLRKIPKTPESNRNFYVSVQSNEDLHCSDLSSLPEKDSSNGNDWSLLNPKTFTYEEEPSRNKVSSPPEEKWIRLKSLSHDDTQILITSTDDSKLLYIDEISVSSQNDSSKDEVDSFEKKVQSITPPPAYSSELPSQSMVENPIYEVPEMIEIEVKDQDTQTTKSFKKSIKIIPEYIPDHNIYARDRSSSTNVETSPSENKTFTLSKNYTLTGPTSYPVYSPTSISNPEKIYSDYLGSAQETSWIKKTKDEDDEE
ncbi:uncharacterized protein [Lepeophtheirus salmonis]|uniref:uncharacterized protein isoform X2 n=1 Tax=Lepeophtheirus salmonis TaxID=72036 RepID=UPI001AE51651|nr:uncharacterized protein LOC121119925 isoform X2 [Lepeophtheirus salmonis]